MRRSSIVWALASVVATGTGLVVIAACSQPPETNYGNPAGLRRDNIPGEGGIEALICTGQPEAGAGGADGGNCGVSWAADIFPLFKNDGPFRCTDAKCHGGPALPLMQNTPAGAYADLVKYQIKGSPLPYINTDAGGDPTKSTIQCNLLSQCGQGMPQAPGRTPTLAENCLIDAWLRCGAPNN